MYDKIVNFLDNKIFVSFLYFLLGVIITKIFGLLGNRRSLLTYTVTHSHIGISSTTQEFGSIQISFQNEDVTNLYATTIELTNESFNDLENIDVKVFSKNAVLRNELTEIIGTTRVLNYSDSYMNQIRVEPGQQNIDTQTEIWSRRREYLIPSLNRGQKVKFYYLTSARNIEETPAVWLDILQSGTVLKYQPPYNKFWDLSRNKAAYLGLFICLLIIIPITILINNSWILAYASFLLGAFVLIIGAFILKGYVWVMNLLRG